MRPWVLSFPIPLRVLFAAQPQLLSPVLHVINRAISSFLIKQAGIKHRQAQTGAVTLIQRFGSAVNLNIHLHGLFLDGVYRIDGTLKIIAAIVTPGAIAKILRSLGLPPPGRHRVHRPRHGITPSPPDHPTDSDFRRFSS